MKEVFINFLKTEGALGGYIRVCEGQGVSLDKKLDRLMGGGLYRAIIDRSFTWERTEEGHVFWNTLDEKWDKLIMDRNDYPQ